MSDIREKIAATLKAINPRVESAVVEVLAAREADKHSAAIVKVWDKLQQAEKDLAKMRPDHIIVDDNGKIITEGYTKKFMELKIKQEGLIAKLISAINKALDKGDYSDVYNLSGGADKSKDQAKGSGDTDTETAG